MEDENPTRRYDVVGISATALAHGLPLRNVQVYKSFRPRQAARGLGDTVNAANFATVMLYNNSAGTHVLALRDVTANGGSVANRGGVIEGKSGGSLASNGVPLITGEAIRAGQILTLDSSSQFSSPDTLIGNFMPPGYAHDFPLAVLNPGWSYWVQAVTGGFQIVVSFIWEAIAIDELDVLDW